MPATTSNLPERYVGLYRRWTGEFVVIVLGILAALAVDSWSEQRDNRILEQEYLSRIKEDLESDLMEIEETIGASFLQARSATTLLYKLDDPLANHVVGFTDSIEAVDFTVPVYEEFDLPPRRMVWHVGRTRSFDPRRGTFDELLATGRIAVIDDARLRAAIIDHYSFTEDAVTGLPEWVDQANLDYNEVVRKSGFNPFDFNSPTLDDPIPLLRELDELPAVLRSVRHVSLRQIFVLESLEESGRELLVAIESHTR
jgi:hypothetical protein